MRILIVGGGKTGYFLADRLRENNEVVLVEQRPERVEFLRAALPDVDTIEGDACEPEVLESAGAGTAGLIVATTGDDEDNLVVAMLTKAQDGGRVYARVNHPRNQWLFDHASGVDVAVSAPALFYGLIRKDLALGDVVTLLDLQADDVSVQEIRLPETASSVGASLAQVALPKNVTVMAILAAGGGVRAARGDTVLGAGDQLLLLAEGELDCPAVLAALGVTEAGREDEAEDAAESQSG